MIYTQFNLPQLLRWQQRLARIPRWAWVAFFVGAMIPIVAMVILAIAFGFFVLVPLLAVSAVIGLVVRLVSRRRRRLSHRGEIVVRAVRVIDP